MHNGYFICWQTSKRGPESQWPKTAQNITRIYQKGIRWPTYLWWGLGFTFTNLSGSVQTEFRPQEMRDPILLPNKHKCSRRLCMWFSSKIRSNAANSCAKRENCNSKVLWKPCIKKIEKDLPNPRPKTGLKHLRLYDNAPAHKARIVTEFLESEKVKVLPHPPYSPDLTPCNYFPFPKLKYHLSGRRYNSRNSLWSAVYQSNRSTFWGVRELLQKVDRPSKTVH